MREGACLYLLLKDSELSEENDGNINGLSGLDDQDCFERQTGLNCIPSGDTLIAFRLKLDKSLDLEGLVRTNNTTTLSDNIFSDKDLLSPKAAM